MERREFLRFAGVAFGAALFDYPLAVAAARQSVEPVVLDGSEWRLLDAVCARILPPVHGVSTTGAGCVNFIDKLLAHEEQALAPAYRAGLAALAAVVAASAQQQFNEFDPVRQDELLAALEEGKLTPWPAAAPAQPEFFAQLRWHTLLGFLADPAYGGNRGGAGWRAIGHPQHPHGSGGVSDEQVTGSVPIRLV